MLIEMESAGIINDIWRSVSSYPSYQVSNIGRVRNTETGGILKPMLSGRVGHEYFRVCLYDNGVRTDHYVHKLVGTEFIDNPYNKPRVDHINGNKTNNCIENLRWAFDNENNMNSRKTSKRTSSIYKWVHWSKWHNKWKATIVKDRKAIHLGYFHDEKEAAKAYNDKAIELFGEFACLNDVSDDETTFSEAPYL